MVRRFIQICAALALAAILTGCTFGRPAPAQEIRTQVHTETLEIFTQGRQITVKDLTGGQEYRFFYRHVRKADQRTAPALAADTDTVKVELLPGCVLRITDKTARQVYTIRRGGGRP